MNQPELLFEGRRFRVQRLFQRVSDGTLHPRDVVRHPDAAAILPLLDDGRVCFVQNYRVAVDETLIELPAGVVEPGEDPAQTARRELAEETGFQARNIQLLATFYTSPGILDERMHLFLATSLEPGQATPEPGEDLQPLLTTWHEALRMAQDGRIRDAKTLAGLLWYEAFGGQTER
jgi:ADP-ribose pyrophosphatase